MSLYSFTMASARGGSGPISHVVLAPAQINEPHLKIIARVLGYLNMILEVYIALHSLTSIMDVCEKYNENNSGIALKSNIAFYAAVVISCVISISFGIALISGTIQNHASDLKAYLFYGIMHSQIVLVIIYYASANYLVNRNQTLILLLFTKIPSLLTLPVVYMAYRAMSKHRPRFIIPLPPGYSPELVPRLTRIRVPVVNSSANSDEHSIEEALPKPEPPPRYELTEVNATT